MKHIFIAIVCLLGSMSLQSCLHDDKEFFDDSAANRIEHCREHSSFWNLLRTDGSFIISQARE